MVENILYYTTPYLPPIELGQLLSRQRDAPRARVGIAERQRLRRHGASRGESVGCAEMCVEVRAELRAEVRAEVEWGCERSCVSGGLGEGM